MGAGGRLSRGGTENRVAIAIAIAGTAVGHSGAAGLRRQLHYPMWMATPYLCLCTCPDADSAEAIATALVNERLAACVNIVPGLRSIYRWEGALQRESEWLLLIKTVAARLDALKTRLPELHPYSVPELVALPIGEGLPAYLQWLAAETGGTDRP